MPIWKVPSVEADPEIVLRKWRVFATERGEHHFVGQNVESSNGRVSSAIIKFDRETRIGTTRSGRRYVLQGPSGRDEDAMHTWTVWKMLNDVKSAKNISSEYEDGHDEPVSEAKQPGRPAL
ncbi:hypothetical protein [Cupriavidus sp. AcVe19-6a]|uniref:hypothetical protein n=1 Tax=Cupriavidus sp. AcVe19-6a TaxID=2821358 RepID=UPI001AE4632A|nr:hypothetical protein [Cupriavidus sp. AcVe19-6a]MBP0638010.1 hypothetical protein [Cupriavidus sp. AcVe19-6a]